MVRGVAPALYVGALSVYMWREGIPVGRERLLLWIVIGLLALSTTNLLGWVRGVVFEWLPFALVLAVYDLLRGHADGLLFSAWYRPQLEADAFLFGGTVPTVWLQDGSGTGRRTCVVRLRLLEGLRELLRGDLRVAGSSGSAPATLPEVRRLRHAARRDGVRDFRALPGRASVARKPNTASSTSTTRLTGPISGHIPFLTFSFEGLCSAAGNTANPVAAVPSLHAAYTLLITLFSGAGRAWARRSLALYPLAMAFALVYTAEHYVFDILLGWAYTL